MKNNMSIKQAVIRLRLIQHGDKETANLWAKQMAKKLIEQEPLSPAESSILASALLGYAERDQAAELFNKGKLPHGSNRLLEDFKLYRLVETYKDDGKTRKEAIRLAGEELRYQDEFSDEWESTATSRYDRVVKSIKSVYDQIRQQELWQDAFDQEFPLK